MSHPHLKLTSPTRSVTDVGPGDYVLTTGNRWERIVTNSAFGAEKTPAGWNIMTEEGNMYDMWAIHLYAKREDFL